MAKTTKNPEVTSLKITIFVYEYNTMYEITCVLIWYQHLWYIENLYYHQRIHLCTICKTNQTYISFRTQDTGFFYTFLQNYNIMKSVQTNLHAYIVSLLYASAYVQTGWNSAGRSYSIRRTQTV